MEIINGLFFRFFAHSQQAGEQIFRWNGKDHLGNNCPDGQYYYLIDVDGVYEISGEINWSASMNHQTDTRIAV